MPQHNSWSLWIVFDVIWISDAQACSHILTWHLVWSGLYSYLLLYFSWMSTSYLVKQTVRFFWFGNLILSIKQTASTIKAFITFYPLDWFNKRKHESLYYLSCLYPVELCGHVCTLFKVRWWSSSGDFSFNDKPINDKIMWFWMSSNFFPSLCCLFCSSLNLSQIGQDISIH